YDHHLSVIAHQIAGCARYGDAAGQQAHLEFSQVLLSAAILKRDQCVNENSSSSSLDEGPLNFWPLQPEDDDFYALFRLANTFDQALDTVARLDDEFHR